MEGIIISRMLSPQRVAISQRLGRLRLETKPAKKDIKRPPSYYSYLASVPSAEPLGPVPFFLLILVTPPKVIREGGGLDEKQRKRKSRNSEPSYILPSYAKETT